MIQRWAEGAEPLPGINHQSRRLTEPGAYGLAEPSRGKPSCLEKPQGPQAGVEQPHAPFQI